MLSSLSPVPPCSRSRRYVINRSYNVRTNHSNAHFEFLSSSRCTLRIDSALSAASTLTLSAHFEACRGCQTVVFRILFRGPKSKSVSCLGEFEFASSVLQQAPWAACVRATALDWYAPTPMRYLCYFFSSLSHMIDEQRDIVHEGCICRAQQSSSLTHCAKQCSRVQLVRRRM